MPKYFISSEYRFLDIPISDSFVDENWRKWEPVLDEASTEIEIDDRWNVNQKVRAEMRQRKEYVVNRVYKTSYEEFTVFVDFSTGSVHYFDNRDYVDEYSGDGKVYLRKRSTGEVKLIYDGEFFADADSDYWVLSSKDRFGGKHYSGIEWRKKKGLRKKSIYIYDHQLIAVMYFGAQAIGFHINHRNLDHYDNRPKNLEILHNRGDNSKHSRLMYSLLEQIIKEQYGYIVTGVWHRTSSLLIYNLEAA